MPKKDTSAAVLGMLSTVGAQTRSPAESGARPEPPAATPTAQPEAAAPAGPAEPAPSGSVSTLPTNRVGSEPAEAGAPRTLRLRPDTARRLRAAWLEAKRDDVLLTAQDFASSLMEDALARHNRRRAAASSG